MGIDKNSSGSINEKQKDGSERQMKATMKSLKSVDLNGDKSDALCVHVSNRHRYLRQSQIDLAIINLMIALVFLTSYSLVWVWAVYDFVCYLSPDTDPEMHVKENPIWLNVSMNVFKVLVVLNSSVNFYIYCLKQVLSSRYTGSIRRHDIDKNQSISLHSIHDHSQKTYSTIIPKTIETDIH